MNLYCFFPRTKKHFFPTIIIIFLRWGGVKESRMIYHDFASKTLGQIKSPKLRGEGGSDEVFRQQPTNNSKGN